MNSALDSIQTSYRFRKPIDSIRNMKERTAEAKKNLDRLKANKLMKLNERLDSAASLLGSYNPENVLKRGYAMVSRNDEVISRNAKLKENDLVNLKFSDGSSDAIINSKN